MLPRRFRPVLDVISLMNVLYVSREERHFLQRGVKKNKKHPSNDSLIMCDRFPQVCHCMFTRSTARGRKKKSITEVMHKTLTDPLISHTRRSEALMLDLNNCKCVCVNFKCAIMILQIQTSAHD